MRQGAARAAQSGAAAWRSTVALLSAAPRRSCSPPPVKLSTSRCTRNCKTTSVAYHSCGCPSPAAQALAMIGVAECLALTTATPMRKTELLCSSRRLPAFCTSRYLFRLIARIIPVLSLQLNSSSWCCVCQPAPDQVDRSGVAPPFPTPIQTPCGQRARGHWRWPDLRPVWDSSTPPRQAPSSIAAAAAAQPLPRRARRASQRRGLRRR